MEESHVKYLMSNDQDMLWGNGRNHGRAPRTSTPASRIPVAQPPHPLSLFQPKRGESSTSTNWYTSPGGRGQFVSTRQRSVKSGGDMFCSFRENGATTVPIRTPDGTNPGSDSRGRTSKNGWQRFFVGRRPCSASASTRRYTTLPLGATVAQQQGSGHQQILAGIVNLLLGFAYSEDRQMAFRDKEHGGQIAKSENPDAGEHRTKSAGRSDRQADRDGILLVPAHIQRVHGVRPKPIHAGAEDIKIQELLTNSEMNCQQIAYAVGLRRPHTFPPCSKTGMTPSQVQTSHRSLL